MERKGLRRWMYPLCSHKSNQSGREGGRAQPLKEWHRLCCPVMSSSLQPHGLQHARPLCPSPSHKVYPSSCPLHRWCHPAISSSDALFSFTLYLFQHQRLFQWVSSLHEVAKVLEFQLQYPSKEHPGLISFRMNWLDLLAEKGTLKSLLQHHNSKASIL